MCDCSEIFLSIIVPVYNCKFFIFQCIDSLYQQDVALDNYEVIIIDDGSDNGAEKIVDELQKNYSNMRVIHKENGGVSSARNEGIRYAHGKYVWFIDADDFVAPNILSKLKCITNEKNSDRIKVDSYTFIDELTFQEVEEMSRNGRLKSNAPYKQLFATRTLYKREYLLKNDITFLEGVHYGEDGVFNYQTLIHNPKTDNSGVLAYFYRKHAESVTMAPITKRVKTSLNGASSVLDVLVDDYNKKICIEQTRRMLLYWMYAILEDYSLLDYDYFCENYSWNYCLNSIPIKDYELRKLQKEMIRISKYRDFNKLNRIISKKHKIDKKNKYRQIARKRNIGYLKHPKRLIKDIKSKCLFK